ncbi:MAG: DegT/DnrJ/EryC1/StrS aminotransferase family protein [Hyphomonadaceae bacterium]|nr:DegT/DnrJ/EryC1/StrS aminotransferase family protein [Hyphomonadaceae bacterium]
MNIAFIDLQAQRRRIADRIDAAIARVLADGRFVMGPEVATLEKALSDFSGAATTLSCANGTDAIALPLMAWDVGPGDAVFCPSFTFAATAEVIPWVGATPVFVDILPATYTMDPAHLEAAISAVRAEGLTPKVVIAVDLFGQPADYPAISAIAKRHGMKLIADSAQSFGCTLHGQHPIAWADAVTTSFFPAKPLGCYGDGGAVQTDDAGLWDVMDSLRVHGKASAADIARETFAHEPKYLNTRIGMNSRLDTLQAAILLEKLAIFADEIVLRQGVAQRYNDGLRDAVLQTPSVINGGVSTWAQYTIEVQDRDGLAAALKEAGVPTAVYYPVPMHKQAVYAAQSRMPGGLPVTEAKAKTVISLPMHPYLDAATQDHIIATVRSFAR